ncbi:MAG TPA: DUF4331 family protein [Bacteriovoracaceae bacterium]|nr:DUF4331 family protein [Bacteriovoracaceae bacterium]
MKTLTLLTLLLLSSNSMASDHIDGPITTKHAVSDITDLYAFPTPGKPGFLTVILNTYPIVPSNGHFADKVSYEISLREASVGTSIKASAGTRISCSFYTPYDHDKHAVQCLSDRGLKATAKVNHLGPETSSSPMRLFAGLRSDPFFFNSDWALAVSNKHTIPAAKSSNTMDQMNVLSIVMDLDLRAALGPAHSKTLALAAQTLTQDGPGMPVRRLDRVGRPEITNVSLVPQDREDLRDLFNQLAPFQDPRTLSGKFHGRLVNNISYYDGLDGKMDWNPVMKESLVSILLDDFLVVDMSKPCGRDYFLEIERALLAGVPHQSCGGRRPGDDIMDTLFTYYVNAGNGARLRDGIDRPYREVSQKFPYLAPADTSASARLKAFVARRLLQKK